MGRQALPTNVFERRCSTCKITKPLLDFHKLHSDRLGHSGKCKICVFQNNRWDRIKREYKLSKDDYTKLLLKQNGVCAICFKPETFTRKNTASYLPRCLAVDHDHRKNKVRGLLCFKCNVGLGVFDDDISKLKSAIRYLETPGE